MKLDQLEHGRRDILDVVPDGDVPANWAVGMEVTLEPRGSNAVLAEGGDVVVVSAAGPAEDVLRRLLAQQLPRIVQLADVTTSHLRLQVNTFAHALPLDLTLAVDDALVEKARRIHKNLKGAGHCLSWLTDQCIIQGKTQHCLLSAGRNADLGEHFVIHGRNVRAQVKAVQGDAGPTWKVVRLTRGKANPERHVLQLAEGTFKFVDATEATRIRVEQRAAMETLRAAADSFMNLWTRYGEIEGEHILRRARQVGALAYERFDRLEDGLVEFHLARAEDRRERVAELGTDDALDVSDAPSAIVTNTSLSWREAIEAHRSNPRTPLLASVVAASDGIIVLRPNESGAFHPPEQGVLSLSLLGDATRLDRRDKARDRVWGADARMPQLAMLLERQPLSSKASSGWTLPRVVRERVFPTHPPTSQQLRAIQLAMETPDAVVVQGPPGTGKTTIIRAVVECLNLQKGDAAAGQILVTGFQHVAVENAIGRMQVNGLPPIKLGQRGAGLGLVEVDQRIEGWRLERLSHLRQRLVDAPDDLRWKDINRLVRSYTLAPTTPRWTVALLGAVADAAAGLIPPSILDEVLELRDLINEEIADDVRAAADLDLQRIVRALRSDPTSWADDGKENAIRLLSADRRREVLQDQERRLLRTLCTTSSPTEEQFRELEGVRRSRLLEITRRLALRDANRPAIRADVAALLLRVRDEAELATRPIRQGPDAVVREYAAELANDAAAVRRAVLAYTPVYAATCQQAAGRQAGIAKADDLQYETVVVDEAARANPLDLLIPMSQARRRLLLVGDHRQLPHMVDEAILEELAEGMDEESLVEKVERAIQDSLFERLFTDFETRPTRGEPCRAITLDEQFRMHPALGDFVSAEFYDSKVRSPRPASDFMHSLEPFAGVPAAWIRVPSSLGEEDRGRSKSREAEASIIAEYLPRLMMSETGRQMTFGVITFYSKQVQLIQQSLVFSGLTESNGQGGFRIAEDWRWLTRPGGETEPRLEIGTVDAFQGREFDVVFLSVVRSNRRPDNTQKEKQSRYGHLMSSNRMCVAMSRQKSLLIAIGDPSLLRAPNAADAIGPLTRFYKLCEEGAGVLV